MPRELSPPGDALERRSPGPPAQRVPRIDVRAYVLRLTRERFCALFPVHFLVGLCRVTRARASETVELAVRQPPGESIELFAAPLQGLEGATGVFRLGRGGDNDIVLDDQHVSRHHASLRVSGDLVVLTDLGSTNGTCVNGARVWGPAGEVVLVGDQIALGSVTLRLLSAAECWDRLRGPAGG